MKTITDDVPGFFEHGGWTFLETDGDEATGEGVVEDSDMEEDDYNPDEDDSEEEGSESDYSGVEEEDEDELKDEDSDSGIMSMIFFALLFQIKTLLLCSEASENLGSDEESGKSWSELEEEARRGKNKRFIFRLY